MKKQAVIYARQSSGSDDYSESVEVQISNCRNLAVQQEISVVGIFSDLNISGKTYPEGWETLAAADRAFQKWLQMNSAHRQFRSGLGKVMHHLSEINFIIVDDITRLYRPLSRSYLESAVNEALIENDVKILQVKGGTLDLAQFDQQLVTMLKNQINDEQIAKQRMRSIEVLNKLRDSGVMPTGIKAFGLIYDRASKTYSVDEEKIKVVKFIFDAVLAYESYSSIVKAVNRCWPHFFKSCFWEKSLYEVIRKPIYAGYQYNTDGNLIENHQGPAVISLQKFLQAQEIIMGKRLKHASNKCNAAGENRHWLPLSGLLYCGNCHSRLVVAIERGKINYFCRRGGLNKNPLCRSSRIAVCCDKPYTAGLLEALQPLLGSALYEQLLKNKNHNNIQEQLASVKEQIAGCGQHMQTLCSEYCKGNIPENVFRETQRQFNAQLRQLRQQELQLKSRCMLDPAEEQKNWQLLWKNYQQNSLTPGQYELLLRQSIEKVVVYHNYIDIFFLTGNTAVLHLPRKRILRQNGFSSNAITRMRHDWIERLQRLNVE